LGLSNRELDARLSALLWALRHDPDEAATRIPGRNLWVAVTTEETPFLRVYLRPREDSPMEAELLWVERRV